MNTKVVQIGILTKDIEKTTKKWADFFGLPVPEIITLSAEDLKDSVYEGKRVNTVLKQSFFEFENVQIELMEPIGDTPSVWHDALVKNGEGIHHIAFRDGSAVDGVKRHTDENHPLLQIGKGYGYVDCMKDMKVILEFLDEERNA